MNQTDMSETKKDTLTQKNINNSIPIETTILSCKGLTYLPELNYLPECIPNLNNLQQLYCNDNKLEKLPEKKICQKIKL